jgi:hypothetical protein
MEAAMQTKDRQQFLIMLTIAAAALYVGINFIFEPLHSWWNTRAAEITDLRGRVHDGRMMIHREDYIRGQWANMQTNALPANTSVAEQQVLHAFDDWARDSGAEITSIMPQWQTGAANDMLLDCRIEAAGDLSNLTRFLYSIENSPMALRVDSVELSAHDNTGQQLTLGLEIDGLALLPTQ